MFKENYRERDRNTHVHIHIPGPVQNSVGINHLIVGLKSLAHYIFGYT